MNTILNSLHNNIISELSKASDKVFVGVTTDYINNWFNNVAMSDKNILATILACDAETVIKDIYKTFIVPIALKKLKEHTGIFFNQWETVKKMFIDNKKYYFLVFRIYYGDISALINCTSSLAKELNIKNYEITTFSKLKEKFKGMLPNQTISFTIQDPSNNDKRIYTAFCIELHRQKYYGFHSVTDADYATLSKGIDNIDYTMITELAKYYNERFDIYFDETGNVNPTLYVLE